MGHKYIGTAKYSRLLCNQVHQLVIEIIEQT